MKTISILFLTLIILTSFNKAEAQITYTITANSNWSSKLPLTCANCTITISTGVTLTLDNNVTCQNCVITGGTITMTNKTLNIQYTGGTPITTDFNGTKVTIYGNSSSVVVNAPLALSNATFSFYNSSTFTTSYEVDLTASQVNLNDSTSMTSTGSSTTPIKLISSSHINVGSGSLTSTASYLVSGPSLDLYDNSTVTLGNNNNVFNNWANYTTAPTAAPAAAQKSYASYGLSLNCGGSGQHACSNPSLFGPATLSASGTVSGNTLPVVLVGFTAVMNNNGTVTLDWDTEIEENASHFEIERSADGSTWNTIGTVQAKGNSTLQTDYSFIDQDPTAAVNYYRLKMVDLDDKYGYTEVKVLRSTLVSKISFFPNPARDYVNVSLAESSASEVTVRLISQSGQVLQEKKVSSANGTTVTLPVQQYATGFYILTVAGDDGTHQSSKLLISRS